MKTILYISVSVILQLFSCCISSRSQNGPELDLLFENHFAVLDSIAMGKKSQQALTATQSSFLYLINSWTDGKAKFEHYKGVLFSEKELQQWRQWYQCNKKNIESNDFKQAMSIYHKFFTDGFLTEEELQILDVLENKYQELD